MLDFQQILDATQLVLMVLIKIIIQKSVNLVMLHVCYVLTFQDLVVQNVQEQDFSILMKEDQESALKIVHINFIKMSHSILVCLVLYNLVTNVEIKHIVKIAQQDFIWTYNRSIVVRVVTVKLV